MKSFLILTAAFIVASLTSCSDHADKIEDTYSGVMTINDSLEVNADIVIERTAKNQINVSNSLFTTYSVEIDKQKYFASKTYYSIDDNEQLEVSDDGLLILTHTENNMQYHFNGFGN